jgi:hypothetical protein
MLGDASDFTPLDMLGSLAINAVATDQACKQESFRVGIAMKNADGSPGDVPVWADFRFLGGLAAAAAAQFGGPNVRRAGHDVAIGLLGSYVSTETCRKHAMKRLEEAKSGYVPQQQLAEGIPAQPAVEAAPAAATATGGPNYAYGW